MKRLNLMFLILGLSIIFFGCSKDDFLAPGVDQSDEGTISLKSAKTGTFTGVCTPVDPDNGVWYDLADDWRVTGTSLWKFESDPGAAEVFGTAELFVDIGKPNGVPPGKPDGVFRGKWEIAWDGIITPILEDDVQIGINIVCDAYGTGTKGAVKGLIAEWTYTMNFLFADPNTFFYATEGVVMKNEKPKTPFSGRCDFLELISGGDTIVLPNGKTKITGYVSKWQDTADDWRVTGTSIWYMNWLIEEDGITAKVWGKADIFLDDERGKWQLSFHGNVTPTDNGFKVVDVCVGTGKEGEVKGMVAKWNHEMNFDFSDPSTFAYFFEGYINSKD